MMKYLFCLLSAFLMLQFSLLSGPGKEKVSMIIQNGTLLTIDKDLTVIENGVVVIQNNKILDVGNKDILNKYTSDNVIDADNGIVMPGMINTHTHAAMSVFRSLGDDVADRLKKYLFPLEKQLVTRQLVYDGTLHAAIEMVRGGVTTMADMYYFEDEATGALKTIGMRGVMGETIMEDRTPDSSEPYGGIEYATKFIKQYNTDDLIIPAYAPHATYSNDTEHLKKIQKLSDEYNVPVLMHVAETKEETEKYKKEHDMSPVKYLDSIGLLSGHLVAAHCLFVDKDDIESLIKNNVGIAHNMEANIKSAKGVAPSLEMYDMGARIGLGTDGPMSSNSLDIINQMGYVAKLQKLTHNNRTVMPAYKVVVMSTIGGAKALHMENKLGSLEKGKLADVIIIETKSPNMVPVYNPYSVLVYSASALNVDTVIINGKIVMKNKKLLTYDEEKDRATVNSYRKKVLEVTGSLE